MILSPKIKLKQFIVIFHILVLNKLVQDFPHKFTKVVTYTTRPPRTNEISGLDYHFITREQMEKQIKNEEFIGKYMLPPLRLTSHYSF